MPNPKLSTETIERIKNLPKLIKQYSPNLIDIGGGVCNKEALLRTFATMESGFGQNIGPRHESAYDKGGLYYRKSSVVKGLVDKYGRDAACSYSSFQIMFPTAVGCGYTLDPKTLAQDIVALPFVVRFLNGILKKNPSTVSQIFDAYNSGNFKDANIPEAYIAKAKGIYDMWNAGKIPQGVVIYD